VTDVLHGDLSTYKNHRCRCVHCRAANAAWSAGWRAGRKTTGGSREVVSNANEWATPEMVAALYGPVVK
jgi:hypothetical protein